MCCRPLNAAETQASRVRLGRSCAPCRGRHKHMFDDSDGGGDDGRSAVAILAADAARRALFVRSTVHDAIRACDS
jgi:hypothetical protein